MTSSRPIVLAVAISAFIAASAYEVEPGQRLTIDKIRDEIGRTLTQQRTDLKEYALRLLTGSAEKASTGREACVEHNIRQFAVAAEALRFLGKQRALLGAHNIIMTRFDPTTPEKMRVSFDLQGEPVERYAVLHKRAVLRGLASGSKAARNMMSLLYLTTKDNYDAVKSNREALAVVSDAFDRSKVHEDSLALAYEDQMKTLNDWDDRGIQSRFNRRLYGTIENAVKMLDDELDYVSFYLGSKEKDPTLYDTYSILNPEFTRFWLNNDMERAIGFNMTTCDGVREYERSEVDSVGRNQFTSLMLKVRQDTRQ